MPPPDWSFRTKLSKADSCEPSRTKAQAFGPLCLYQRPIQILTGILTDVR